MAHIAKKRNSISKGYHYISLQNDYAFRELFSYENIRKQFLSDVLGIPLDKIKSVRITNPYLWKRFRRQKLGILDMNLEMQDGTKVNIEMQVRQQEHWVRRQLFYLAKMYTEDLREGQDYGRLRRCISIGILGFQLTEDKKYHSIYRLRDEQGRELSDLLEVHILELTKELQGTSTINDWIQLFNANSKEDLEMIKTKNTGILEAMEILKNMNLHKTLRSLHEERLKAIRDRKAEDDFVRNQGRAEGMAVGKAEDIIQLLSEQGDIPSDLREKIMTEKNMDTLSLWLKIAARAESIDQFREICGLSSTLD